MILHHSHAGLGYEAKPLRYASRVRIGTGMLARVLVLLALLNVVAGAA